MPTQYQKVAEADPYLLHSQQHSQGFATQPEPWLLVLALLSLLPGHLLASPGCSQSLDRAATMPQEP